MLQSKIIYKFYGNLNNFKKNQYISLLLILSVFVFIPLAFFLNNLGIIISFLIVFTILVLILNKFNNDDNLIIFTEENIIHLENKLFQIYLYENLSHVEFIYQPKGYCYYKIYVNDKVFKFNVEVKTNNSSHYKSWYELLLHKNKNICIIENGFFEKHKIFLYNNEVKKIRL